MRSMYSKEVLFVEAAKKKPRLQALLDNLENMTEDDINQLNEAKWIRDALLRMIETKGTTQKQRLAQIVVNATAADEKAYNDRFLVYEVRTWNSEQTTIDGRTPGWEAIGWAVDLKVNEPFMIRSDDMFVIGGEFYKLSPSDWKKVIDGSSYFQNMTQQDYFNYYNLTYLSSII